MLTKPTAAGGILYREIICTYALAAKGSAVNVVVMLAGSQGLFADDHDVEVHVVVANTRGDLCARCVEEGYT